MRIANLSISQIVLKLLVLFGLFLLHLGLFPLQAQGLLFLVGELGVLLSLHHLLLQAVVLLLERAGPGNFLEEGSSLFRVFHRDRLDGSLFEHENISGRVKC